MIAEHKTAAINIEVSPEQLGAILKGLGMRPRLVFEAAASPVGPSAPNREPRTSRHSKLDSNCILLPSTATDHDIVLDHETNLMWAAFHPGEEKMPWADANKAASDLRLGGFTDWAAPTPQQITTILDYDRNGPAFDTALFPRWQKSGWAWLSKPYKASPSDYAWDVGLSYGYVGWGNQSYDGVAVACRRVPASQ